MDYGSYLGKTRDNPNKRSTQYKKQSPFEGSVRQVRGRILSYLVRNGNTLTRDLYSEIDLPPERIDPVLASLVDEGFIVMEGDIVKIT
jgi:A/G-specific adenine glycosylase